MNIKHLSWRCDYSLLIGFGSPWELCDKSLPQAMSGICSLYLQVNVWETELRLRCYGPGFGTSPPFIDGNLNPLADRDADGKPSGRGSINKVKALMNELMPLQKEPKDSPCQAIATWGRKPSVCNQKALKRPRWLQCPIPDFTLPNCKKSTSVYKPPSLLNHSSSLEWWDNEEGPGRYRNVPEYQHSVLTETQKALKPHWWMDCFGLSHFK